MKKKKEFKVGNNNNQNEISERKKVQSNNNNNRRNFCSQMDDTYWIGDEKQSHILAKQFKEQEEEWTKKHRSVDDQECVRDWIN